MQSLNRLNHPHLARFHDMNNMPVSHTCSLLPHHDDCLYCSCRDSQDSQRCLWYLTCDRGHNQHYALHLVGTGAEKTQASMQKYYGIARSHEENSKPDDQDPMHIYLHGMNNNPKA